MLEVLECTQANLVIGRGEQRFPETIPSMNGSGSPVREKMAGQLSWDEPMPTGPDLPMTQQTYMPWLAGCVLYTLEPPNAPS